MDVYKGFLICVITLLSVVMAKRNSQKTNLISKAHHKSKKMNSTNEHKEDETNRGDGKLSLNEFQTAFRSSQAPTHVPQEDKPILEAFKMFDHDSDGLLRFDEVSEKLQQLTSEATAKEINKAVTKADRNSNGIIDYAEFARALRKNSFDLPSADD